MKKIFLLLFIFSTTLTFANDTEKVAKSSDIKSTSILIFDNLESVSALDNDDDARKKRAELEKRRKEAAKKAALAKKKREEALKKKREEEKKKDKRDENKVVKNKIKVYDTNNDKLYYFVGSTTGSAIFRSNSDSRVSSLLKMANIKGMIGTWIVYDKNGNVVGKFTIEQSRDGKYYFIK